MLVEVCLFVCILCQVHGTWDGSRRMISTCRETGLNSETFQLLLQCLVNFISTLTYLFMVTTYHFLFFTSFFPFHLVFPFLFVLGSASVLGLTFDKLTQKLIEEIYIYIYIYIVGIEHLKNGNDIYICCRNSRYILGRP